MMNEIIAIEEALYLVDNFRVLHPTTADVKAR